MSKVFNMVGGGGKNISSIIITGLESTDTVTCTKDGKSYAATWDETAQHWEIVGLPLGTFTITATNGTKTKTETVLIDIAGIYEIEMALKLWLYREGDECEDVTGGWGIDGWSFPGYTIQSFSKTDNAIKMTASSSSSIVTAIATKNTIGFNGYSKLCFEVNVESVASDGARVKFANIKNMNDNQSGVVVVKQFNVSGNNVYVIELDGTWTEAYISINCWLNYYSVGDITKIWLQ